MLALQEEEEGDDGSDEGEEEYIAPTPQVGKKQKKCKSYVPRILSSKKQKWEEHKKPKDDDDENNWSRKGFYGGTISAWC